MSDQREMTLDEFLESKLPDFHLARRQLLELREERDAMARDLEEERCHRQAVERSEQALAAHVERLRTSLELAKSRIGLLADVATRKGAAVYAAIDIWPGEMDKVIEQSPETSLVNLKEKWKAGATFEAADYIRYEYEGEIHLDRIAESLDNLALSDSDSRTND